jgi:hypothetical protein
MDSGIALAMAADLSSLQARIKELEASLEHQKKLSAELQTALLFGNIKQNAKQKRNKYRKDTPLKTYIQNNWNNGDVRMRLAESLGVTVGNIPKTMLRSYLSIMYKNLSNPEHSEPTAKKAKVSTSQVSTESESEVKSEVKSEVNREANSEVNSQSQTKKGDTNSEAELLFPPLKSYLDDLRLSDGTNISEWL